MGYLTFPKWASREFRENNYRYELELAFENELNDKFSLGYNMGTSNDFKNYKLTMGLGYAVSNSTSTYIEYFSNLNKIKNIHSIDIGLLQLINPRLQVDIACGSPVIGDKFNFFTTFGISSLFK